MFLFDAKGMRIATTSDVGHARAWRRRVAGRDRAVRRRRRRRGEVMGMGEEEPDLYCVLSFADCSCLYSGDPFGADAPLPLEGAALRGETSSLAPLLGSEAAAR